MYLCACVTEVTYGGNMQLSLSDQRLVEELYTKGVLKRADLLGIDDPSRAFVITDVQCGSPQISHNQCKGAAFTFALPGGALLLDPDLQSEGLGYLSQYFMEQILKCHKSRLIDYVALVVRVPSESIESMDLSIVDVIDHLFRAKKVVKSSIHHLKIFDFLSISWFEHGAREHLFSVDPKKFRVWYDRYEQNVLGRDATDIDDLSANEQVHFAEA